MVSGLGSGRVMHAILKSLTESPIKTKKAHPNSQITVSDSIMN